MRKDGNNARCGQWLLACSLRRRFEKHFEATGVRIYICNDGPTEVRTPIGPNNENGGTQETTYVIPWKLRFIFEDMSKSGRSYHHTGRLTRKAFASVDIFKGYGVCGHAWEDVRGYDDAQWAIERQWRTGRRPRPDPIEGITKATREGVPAENIRHYIRASYERPPFTKELVAAVPSAYTMQHRMEEYRMHEVREFDRFVQVRRFPIFPEIPPPELAALNGYEWDLIAHHIDDHQRSKGFDDDSCEDCASWFTCCCLGMRYSRFHNVYTAEPRKKFEDLRLPEINAMIAAKGMRCEVEWDNTPTCCAAFGDFDLKSLLVFYGPISSFHNMDSKLEYSAQFEHTLRLCASLPHVPFARNPSCDAHRHFLAQVTDAPRDGNAGNKRRHGLTLIN